MLFRDQKKREWKQGTALVRYGKTLYLKYGNFLRRVPIDLVIPDSRGAEKVEESFVEPLDQEELRFLSQETPIDAMVKDIETATENESLKKKVVELETKINQLEADKDQNQCVDEDRNLINNKRKERRSLQKEKKKENRVTLPLLGQWIKFREVNSELWQYARVFGTYKRTSKYKFFRQLELKDGDKVEKDFVKDIEEWEVIHPEAETEKNEEETFLTSLNDNEIYGVNIIPRSDWKNEEVREAMRNEIKKYESFEAYEEIDDNGQKCIPMKWVVTRSSDEGKNQPIKARLCIRGDLENGKENIRADSPTAGKDTLKLALMISANQRWRIKSCDIKSAYLQGQDLERDILVRPPTEYEKHGKIWRLKKAAYGVLDGGRLFYLKLKEELDKLGLHKVHADGALFTFVKDGLFRGFVACHVDDLLMGGDKIFEEQVELKLLQAFQYSKVEKDNFKYCGTRIRTLENGDIQLDQNEYIESIAEMDKTEGDSGRKLNSYEQKQLRGKIGEVLWLSLMTRPDLSFDVNKLASEVPEATVDSVKFMNSVIRKAKRSPHVLNFTRLGNLEDMSVKLYTDASFKNQIDGIRSTEGKVILIENKKTGVANVVSWKTKKIPRICRSAKAAETRALDDGIDDAINIARIIREIFTGSIDLKEPNQIPVYALIDSKSVWENLHSTKQCEEKLLRNTIASLKELLDLGYVKSIDWVSTELQLADCLTKLGSESKSRRLMAIFSDNRIAEN